MPTSTSSSVLSARWRRTPTRPPSTLAGPGGQAANVAAWVAALGGQSRLICARGTDLAAGPGRGRPAPPRGGAGRAGHRGPDRRGGVAVGRRRDPVDADRPRRRARSLAAAELRAGLAGGCAWLHLPAYSLVADPISGAARAAVAAAAARPARLSIDFPRRRPWPSYGAARFARPAGGLAPDVVFGTEAEMALVGDMPRTGARGQARRPRCPGRRGASIRRRRPTPVDATARATRSRPGTCSAGSARPDRGRPRGGDDGRHAVTFAPCRVGGGRGRPGREPAGRGPGDHAGLARLLGRPRAAGRPGVAGPGAGRRGRAGHHRDHRRPGPGRAGRRRAGAVRRGRHRRPQGWRPGHRGLPGPGRARGDNGRRHARRVRRGGHPVHGHRRHRRRAPGLRRQPGHFR